MFGALLREYRTTKLVSQAELVDKLGELGFALDTSYVSKLENERRHPGHREVVSAFAKVLNLGPLETAKLLVSAGYTPQDPSVSIESSDNVLESLSLFADMVDTQRLFRAGHSRRVWKIARAIAVEMGLTKEELRNLEIAARLHDIGYVNISSYTILKEGALTVEEWHAIRYHPTAGVDLLRPLLCFGDALPIIQSHHERCDGTGYPSGLSKNEICLSARILAVADVCDVLASPRRHRPALGREQINLELRRVSKRQFDPDVVSIFEKLGAQSDVESTLNDARNSGTVDSLIV